MTATVPADWDDLIETLRSDLETVSSGDAEDEEVRAAIDEVWTIVDAAEERVGSVDAEQIGDVLGVAGNGDSSAIDPGSIPRELVLDDPGRAAGLSRLVTLINVDEATDYDVGRLWRDEEDGPADSDEDGSGDGDDSGAQSAEETEPDSSADDSGEALRAELGDALSQFRDKIQDAREGIDGPTERGEDTDDRESGGGTEEADGESSSDGPFSKRRSTSSGRSSTMFSTVPSERHDMDGPSHLSTMPGRQRRSRTSTSSDRGGEEDDRSDEE